MSVSTLLQTAGAHHRAGRLADAERAYRGLIQQHPNHLDARVNIGQVLVFGRRFSEAATTFEHAVALAPDLIQFRVLAGCGVGE